MDVYCVCGGELYEAGKMGAFLKIKCDKCSWLSYMSTQEWNDIRQEETQDTECDPTEYDYVLGKYVPLGQTILLGFQNLVDRVPEGRLEYLVDVLEEAVDKRTLELVFQRLQFSEEDK